MPRGPIPDKPKGRPTVPEVLPRARSHMERTDWIGGALHVSLSDGNLGDDSLEFCARKAHEQGDAEAEEIARLMLQMTGTQRRRIYGGLRG